MIEQIKATRSSDVVVKLALAINAVLTFMFGFNYLAELFDVFHLMGDEANEPVIRFISGVAVVILFDAAYYAWGQISHRDELSGDQIATADTARNWSLYGSLAASAGQFVLAQGAVTLNANLVFMVSLLAMIFVGAIAICHMYWYSQFQSQSFAAGERARLAAWKAEESEISRKRAAELAQLDREKQDHEHQLMLQEIAAKHELEMEKAKAEAHLHQSAIKQQIEHQRKVFAKAGELLDQMIDKNALEVARRRAATARDKFFVEMGHDPDQFRSNGNGA